MCLVPEHANGAGSVHGAVLTALADLTLGRAIALEADRETHPATVSLSLDFLAPAPPEGWLEAEASVLRIGRRLAVATGLLRAGSILVARASGTYTLTHPARRAAGGPSAQRPT
jgi:acyl-coenzyme A thioesterase 13